MHSLRVCGCWHPDCIPRGSATFAVLQSLNQAKDANFDVECELRKSDAVAKTNTLLPLVNGLYINGHYVRQSVDGQSPSRYMPPATATFSQTKPLRMSSVDSGKRCSDGLIANGKWECRRSRLVQCFDCRSDDDEPGCSLPFPVWSESK